MRSRRRAGAQGEIRRISPPWTHNRSPGRTLNTLVLRVCAYGHMLGRTVSAAR
ncbi:hypothetical protein I546_2922 [Mycobacterium kansasii 732]|nr:hypothetical protein I546_2922 [Mycobacterium kansasii 732]